MDPRLDDVLDADLTIWYDVLLDPGRIVRPVCSKDWFDVLEEAPEEVRWMRGWGAPEGRRRGKLPFLTGVGWDTFKDGTRCPSDDESTPGVIGLGRCVDDPDVIVRLRGEWRSVGVLGDVGDADEIAESSIVGDLEVDDCSVGVREVSGG
jgi:hypothetical protein